VTKKEFLNTVAHGKVDVLQVFLDALTQQDIDYCVVGGLAVNAYTEPVVSLDLDVVITASDIEAVCASMAKYFKIERFPNSVNLSSKESDLRIQLQTDPRYQEFIRNAAIKNVLGYEMKVAARKDVLAGKIWAYSDKERRMSKRQKDLADIARLIEAYPELADKLPAEIRNKLK
jgi:hypothetical protein